MTDCRYNSILRPFIVRPDFFHCAIAPAWIGTDRGFLSRLFSSDSLLVGTDREKPQATRATEKVVYCPRIDPGLHPWLIEHSGAAPSGDP
jgi:hypothetical protein